MNLLLKSLLFSTIFSCVNAKEFLSFADYLSQVEQNNKDYIATGELQQSYTTRALESQLLTAPVFDSSARAGFQKDPQLIPSFPIFLPNFNLINEEYIVGVKQDTPIGLEWQLSCVSNLFQVKSDVPLPKLATEILPVVSDHSLFEPTWTTVQGLTIKQHLWKNAFGQRIRAQVSQAKHSALAQAYQEEFKNQNARAQAENIYWQLVIARELKQIRKETYEQTEKLMTFIERKWKDSLALESEVYQARTLLNSSYYDYRKADEEETGISLSFNALRAISSPEVPEHLVLLSKTLVYQLTPQTKGERSDLKMQEELYKSQKAQNIMAINDLRPDFDVSASVGLQGQSSNFVDSFNRSFNHPALGASIYVKLTIPISPYKISAIKRAYRSNTRAAKLNYQRMKFEHNQQWDQLQTRLEENKQLLVLLFENAAVQKAKFENAQVEYNRGLTTSFAVTSALNDYQASKIALLQTFQTILNIHLNLGLYESS